MATNQEIQEQLDNIRETAQAATKDIKQLADYLKEVSIVNRQLDLQRRKGDMLLGAPMGGDMETTVVAEWVSLNEDGTGTVSYNDKKYKTVPLTAYSLAPGTKVQLFF